MVTGIDHLVIAVDDLDAAAAELETRVGLAVTGGGRHEGAGTANRIAFLADGSYLELIAVEDPDAARRWPVGAAALRTLEERGSGLACYALVDDRLEVTVAALRANGSSIGAVQAGSRRRPDGELVRWWSAAPASLGIDGVPFLIRHAYTGAEWGPGALAQRRVFAHPIGTPVSLARLEIAVPHPLDLAARYLREVGLQFWSLLDLATCSVGRHVIRLVRAGDLDPPPIVALAGGETGRSVTVQGIRVDVEPVRGGP